MSTAAESGRVIFYGAACREDVLASVRFVIKKKKKKKDYKSKQQQYQAINEITHLGELSVHS